MAEDRISLSSESSVSRTQEITVGQTKASIDIVTATSSATGWTVDLQYSIELGDDEQWRNFSPAVQFTDTTPSRRNISVVGSGNIRLKTSTAVGAADEQARVAKRVY